LVDEDLDHVEECDVGDIQNVRIMLVHGHPQ
jgi:hypothetical protein